MAFAVQPKINNIKVDQGERLTQTLLLYHIGTTWFC